MVPSRGLNAIPIRGILIGAVVFALLAACAHFLAGGSIVRTVFCLMIPLAPFAVYLVIKWPFIFPFAFYVCLIPLNEILYFGQFGTVSKLLGALSFVALALWLVRKRVIIKPQAATLAWLALALWIIAGGMWAINHTDWLGDLTPGGAPGVTTFLELLGLYLIIAVVPVRANDWKAICIGAIAGGVVASALSVYQLYRTSGFAHNRLWLTGVGGDTADPNHFAGALLLAVFLTTAAALAERKALAKLALMLCLCMLMGGIYLTGSRDAVVAVALGFLYMMWRGRHRAQLGMYMVAAVLAAVPLLSGLAARFTLAASDSGAGRLFIWRVGLDALKTYWLLGAGLQNFRDAFDQAYLHVYMQSATGYHYSGHNLFITSAVELGLFGAALMILAWFCQFAMFRDIDRTSQFFDGRVALEACLLALFVTSLFLDNMLEKYTWLTFCVMAAFRSRYITSLNEQIDVVGPEIEAHFDGPIKSRPEANAYGHLSLS